MYSLPVRVTWLATGNNVRLTDEFTRRTVPIRLDAGVERPEERAGFRHSDLRQWTRTNRAALVSACLSLTRAWVEAGLPKGTRTLDSFESWARVVGGILEWVEVDGFLDGRDRLYREAAWAPPGSLDGPQ